MRMVGSVLLLCLVGFVTAPDASAYAPGIAGCNKKTVEYSNETAAAITDSGTITSSVSVSGQSGTIIDVDVFTNISHTSNGDLEISLASPTGTSVTLTTDNGGGDDDVFAGTLWDDQADPYSPIPLTSLATYSLATKHDYVDARIAGPLVPEEGLVAFNGDSPEGTWTLTIHDDSAGDTGTRTSWKLRITTCETQPATSSSTFSNSAVVAIPSLTTVSSTVTASGLKTSLCGVKLTTNITHTFPGDLEVTLTSPNGTVATVTDNFGSSADDVFNGTVWEGRADLGSVVPYGTAPNIVSDATYTSGTAKTSLTPAESFAVFYGDNPNGVWTLTIRDSVAGDTGNLNSWSLELTTCAPDADSDGTADEDDDCTGVDADTNSNGTADCLESDLRPTSLRATRSGSSMTCSFVVKNFGPVAAAASQAQIRFGVASDSTGKVRKTENVPSLAAGASSSRITVTKPRGSSRYCRFVVDSGNALTETNETNNAKSKLVR